MNRLHDAWCWFSPRFRSCCKMLLPVFLFLAAIGVFWVHHHLQGTTSREDSMTLFRRVGIASYIAALAMLIFERRWTLQSLGLFGLLLAGAELKFRLLAHGGPQPMHEWERDLTQATFEVAALSVIVSVFVFAIGRGLRRWRNPPEDDTISPEDECDDDSNHELPVVSHIHDQQVRTPGVG